MKLYHTTTADAAAAIVQAGFRDVTGHYGFITLMAKPSRSLVSGSLTGQSASMKGPPVAHPWAIWCLPLR